MSFSKKLRTLLLSTTFFGVLLVLGKTFFFPLESRNTRISFDFPTAVPLESWHPIANTSMKSWSESFTYLQSDQLIEQYYRYTRDNIPLEIRMYYVNGTDGSTNLWLKDAVIDNSAVVPQLPVIRQDEEIGFYTLFANTEQAYLSSCINRFGRATVTSEQFARNLNLYTLNLERIIPWLLGQQELRDKSCLWTTLSIPLQNSSPDIAYQTLEEAWESWYRWWKPKLANSIIG